eukprot:g12794.t1
MAGIRFRPRSNVTALLLWLAAAAIGGLDRTLCTKSRLLSEPLLARPEDVPGGESGIPGRATAPGASGDSATETKTKTPQPPGSSCAAGTTRDPSRNAGRRLRKSAAFLGAAAAVAAFAGATSAGSDALHRLVVPGWEHRNRNRTPNAPRYNSQPVEHPYGAPYVLADTWVDPNPNYEAWGIVDANYNPQPRVVDTADRGADHLTPVLPVADQKGHEQEPKKRGVVPSPRKEWTGEPAELPSAAESVGAENKPVWRIPTTHSRRKHDASPTAAAWFSASASNSNRQEVEEQEVAPPSYDIVARNLHDTLIYAEVVVGKPSAPPLKIVLDTGSSDNWVLLHLARHQRSDEGSRNLLKVLKGKRSQRIFEQGRRKGTPSEKNSPVAVDDSMPGWDIARDAAHLRCETEHRKTKGNSNSNTSTTNDDSIRTLDLRYGTGEVWGADCREQLALVIESSKLPKTTTAAAAAREEGEAQAGSAFSLLPFPTSTELVLVEEVDADFERLGIEERISGILGLGLQGLAEGTGARKKPFVQELADAVRKAAAALRGNNNLEQAETTSKSPKKPEAGNLLAGGNQTSASPLLARTPAMRFEVPSVLLPSQYSSNSNEHSRPRPFGPPQPGTLVLGEYAHVKTHGGFEQDNILPVLPLGYTPHDGALYGYWTVKVEGVWWTGLPPPPRDTKYYSPTPRAKSTPVVSTPVRRAGRTVDTTGFFDSGTTLLILPDATYLAFLEACYPYAPVERAESERRKTPQYLPWPTKCCYARHEYGYDNPLTLHIQMNGVDYRLTAQDLCGVEEDALISRGLGDHLVFGEVFHRAVPVTYLLEKPFAVALPGAVGGGSTTG